MFRTDILIDPNIDKHMLEKYCYERFTTSLPAVIDEQQGEWY